MFKIEHNAFEENEKLRKGALNVYRAGALGTLDGLGGGGGASIVTAWMRRLH